MPNKEFRETSISSAQDTGKKPVDLTRLLAQKTWNNDQLRGKAHMTREQERAKNAIQHHNELLARFAIAEERRGTPPSSDNKVPLGLDRHRYGGIGGQTKAGEYAQRIMGEKQYLLYLEFGRKHNHNNRNPKAKQLEINKEDKAANARYIYLKRLYNSGKANEGAGSSQPTNNEAGSSRPTTGQIRLNQKDQSNYPGTFAERQEKYWSQYD